jgi:hypothetical protein
MTQVENAEPEDLSKTDHFSKEARCFPTVGTREHAELIQAIMLNFPEIYEKAEVLGGNMSPIMERIERPK